MSVNWRATIAAEGAQDFPAAPQSSRRFSVHQSTAQISLPKPAEQFERRASQSLALGTMANSKLCRLHFRFEGDLTAMTAALDFHVAPRPATDRDTDQSIA